jgi:GH24 family phage-related lysozyme (muramidase)
MELTEAQLRFLIREVIRKVKGGWKVYPKKPRKGEKRRRALSKKPLSYKRALAQLRAIERGKSLKEGREHTIVSGDYLGKIAKKYGVTTSQIQKANPDLNPNSLQLGQKIIIPDALKRLNKDLKPSEKLIVWMKYEEGKVNRLGVATGEPYLKSYNDGVGNLTIGYGRNQKSQRKQTIDKGYAENLLKSDLSDAASLLQQSTKDSVSEKITIPFKLDQNQFDALTSIIFNAGRGGYIKTSLHQKFISKGITSGSEFEKAFLEARTSKKLGGLKGRRKRELEIFKNNNYLNKKDDEKSVLKEGDPKVGTGKKPKGSGRRLYTDENPKDTVPVKFRTASDIRKTFSQKSFKSKSHNRQSQIINLVHQRVRAAYQNAKDPDTKKRLKKAYDYAKKRKAASKKKTQRMRKKK